MTDVTISGPISAYCYEFNGRRFFFFGDQHQSTKRGCGELYGKRCDRMNYSFTSVIKEQSQCWTILALFMEWFAYNKRNGKKTDFYLEFPYHKSDTLGNLYDQATSEIDRRRLGARPPDIRNMTAEQRSELRKKDPLNKIGWLGMIGIQFSDCLVKDKTKCQYGPEVRVHYADVRQFVLPQTEVGRQTVSGQYDYFSLGGRRLVGTFKKFVGLLNGDRLSNDQYRDLIIQMLNMVDEYALLAEIIASNSSEFFQLYISPDGYEQLHKHLMNLIPTETELGAGFKRNLEGIERLIKVRPDGKRMHRAAAELIRLSEEGSSEIAEMIVNFSEYYVNTNVSALNGQLEAFAPHVQAAEELKQEILNKDELSHENLMLFLDYFNEFLSPMLISIDVSAIVIGANIMDVYTLSRMFILTDSEEVVIFAGDAHVSSYVMFFEGYLKAQNLYYHPSQADQYGKTKRCVGIPELQNLLDLGSFRQ